MNYRTPNCVSAGLPARSLPGRLSFRVFRCVSFPYSLLITRYWVLRTQLSTLASQGLPRRLATADLCTASRFLRHWCRSCRLPEVVDSLQLAQHGPHRKSLSIWARLAQIAHSPPRLRRRHRPPRATPARLTRSHRRRRGMHGTVLSWNGLWLQYERPL